MTSEFAPTYRFCWWCSKQLYGSGHRDALCDGQPVRVHAMCVAPMMKNHEVSVVTCTEECPCRAPGKPQ